MFSAWPAVFAITYQSATLWLGSTVFAPAASSIPAPPAVTPAKPMVIRPVLVEGA